MTKTLAELLSVLPKAESVKIATSLAAIAITDLCVDSRKVKAGDCFFAYPGETFDSRSVIKQALAQGAAVVLAEYDETDYGMQPVVLIRHLKEKLSLFAAHFYNNPTDKLTVIGVTGTNGKTSLCHYLAQAAGKLGQRCGVLGTLGNGILGKLQPSALTTSDPIAVQRDMAAMVTAGLDMVAMEVSSHALTQGRVQHVHFDAAVFTNLSQDHLDYHCDMDDYLAAKRRLFTEYAVPLAIINSDEAVAEALLEGAPESMRVVHYGLKTKAAYRCTNVTLSEQAIQTQCETSQQTVVLQLQHILGDFNVSNSLAVIATLCELGHELSATVEAVAGLTPVPGRMQQLPQAPKQPRIIIDYAHTPQALERALSALRQHFKRRIWCVFGCGGDRDRSKRSEMGQIAINNADYCVITDDNPRTESPQQIISDILTGVTGEAYTIIHDRASAIAYALQQAAVDDVVLIAGKGHETYQIIGERRYPFSDEAVVQAYWHQMSKDEVS